MSIQVVANTQQVAVDVESMVVRITPFAAGGPGGGIESVVAGANVTVDDTDPVNPVVSADVGTSDLATLVDTTDPRLSDARTPTAHAATHASGGTDPLTPAAIGARPTGPIPVGDLQTTGTPDGTQFLRDDGQWATPAGGGGGLAPAILPVRMGASSGTTTHNNNRNLFSITTPAPLLGVSAVVVNISVAAPAGNTAVFVIYVPTSGSTAKRLVAEPFGTDATGWVTINFTDPVDIPAGMLLVGVPHTSDDVATFVGMERSYPIVKRDAGNAGAARISGWTLGTGFVPTPTVTADSRWAGAAPYMEFE